MERVACRVVRVRCSQKACLTPSYQIASAGPVWPSSELEPRLRQPVMVSSASTMGSMWDSISSPAWGSLLPGSFTCRLMMWYMMRCHVRVSKDVGRSRTSVNEAVTDSQVGNISSHGGAEKHGAPCQNDDRNQSRGGGSATGSQGGDDGHDEYFPKPRVEANQGRQPSNAAGDARGDTIPGYRGAQGQHKAGNAGV